MFHFVDNKPKPAVFMYDKQGLGRADTEGNTKVHTIWWISPMKSGDFQAFVVRNNQEMQSTDLPPDARARALDARDKELIAACLSKIENCYEPGDCITDPGEIAKVLDMLDFSAQQDLLTWCRSSAALDAATK